MGKMEKLVATVPKSARDERRGTEGEGREVFREGVGSRSEDQERTMTKEEKAPDNRTELRCFNGQVVFPAVGSAAFAKAGQ